MEDDWGLQAVVRGCSAASSTTTTTSSSTTTTTTWYQDSHQPSSFHPFQGDYPVGFPDLFEPRSDNSIEQFLNHLCNPHIFHKSQKAPLSPQNLPISPLSVLGGLQDLSHQQQQQQQPQPQYQQKQYLHQPKQFFGSSNRTPAHTQNTRSKKRKNQLKRVCQVPAEGLSSDMWSWRKYGQKPIKGSPYPRGYYRCSTSKGCLARKQVERNRSDPGMFIVTYTGEHNHPMPTHRNTLAGSTRNHKPSTSGDDTNKPSCSSPVSPAASLSPATGKTEREDTVEEEDDEDEFGGVSEMVIGDDFFEGLEELVGPDAGDCLSNHFPATPPFPWFSNNATTTTTAAGGS